MLAVVVAISAPGDADNGRRLIRLATASVCISFHQCSRSAINCVRPEGFADDVCFTAKMFRQCPFAVPEQDLGRRCFAPLFEKAAEQFIVIGIDQRLPPVPTVCSEESSALGRIVKIASGST
ncbi:MAG: hypothetical protein ACLR2G_10380 [Phascolarctobacterium faecium]